MNPAHEPTVAWDGHVQSLGSVEGLPFEEVEVVPQKKMIRQLLMAEDKTNLGGQTNKERATVGDTYSVDV